MTTSTEPRSRRARCAVRRAAVLLLLAAPLPLLAKECADCHSGQDQTAGKAILPANSAHAGLECAECHTGLRTLETAQAVGQKVHGDKPRSPQCKSCHADQTKALGDSSHGGKLKQHLESKGDTRAASGCRACHSGDPHAMALVKNPQAPTSRMRVAGACLACHAHEQTIAVGGYLNSAHGKAVAAGNTKAAVCTDCHGSHAIAHSRLPQSSAFRATVPKTCGQCHEQEHKEYQDSIHWTGAQKGFRESPVCSDCHGEHAIRSKQDPLSATAAHAWG